jgi:dienelactone hydrolase
MKLVQKSIKFGLFLVLFCVMSHGRCEVVMLPVAGNEPTTLQTTLYIPDGPGPHPLAVLNHGRSPAQGTERPGQNREVFQSAASVLVKLGYLVAIPMRRGYAGSGGQGHSAKCDIARMAVGEAGDIKDAIDVLVSRPDVDAQNILLIGQSMGGLAVSAFGATYPDYPGVKALVNFAGGLNRPGCHWAEALVSAYASFGKTARIPMLWLYGDNDSFWGPSSGLPTQLYQAYTENGGKAVFLQYGKWGVDSHKLFSDWYGKDVWSKPVTDYMKDQGLPSKPQ